jgi:hypothetical protein
MAKFEDIGVKCPYYSWEEGNRLCCEGVNKISRVQLMFDTKEGRREYERQRCKRCWKDCPLAQALNKMWEEMK